MWQDLDAQQLYGNQYLQSAAAGQVPSSSSARAPAALDGAGVEMGFGMPGLEGLGLGMGTDMNMNTNNMDSMGPGMNMDIDDFLRATNVGNSGGEFPPDWTQWGNLDMNDPEN